MADALVRAAQEWVNATYSGVSGYVPVEENGITGWRTMWALTRGLQIELGITALSDNFGATTESRFTAQIGTVSSQTTNKNVVRILQCALWCKGYPGGAIDGTFSDTVATSCVRVKQDIGLGDTAPNIPVKVMKSLLSMDAYVVSSYNGGSSRVRTAQQWLNTTYLHRRDFPVVPCDGVFSRDVQKALVLAIQYELGMADGTANGNFGEGTQNGLRTKGVVVQGSRDGSTRFVRLFQSALLFNGYDLTLDGSFGPATAAEVKKFQQFAQLPVNGNGDYDTWCSLLVSTGNPDRKGTGADTNRPLTKARAAAIYDAGYRVVGRYLSGPTKRILADEIITILDAGLTLVPIYQVYNNAPEYFDEATGFEHGWSAVLRARQLGIKPGAIIWFPVDFDAMGGDISTLVLPFFRGVRAGVGRARDGEFRVGVYGPRYVCQRVLDAGLAVAAWASGIPRGWSGNLGYPLPDKWAYDQVQTLTVGSGAGLVEIDKNIVSPTAESLGRNDTLPTPTRDVLGTAIFNEVFTRLTQLSYEAEVVLEHHVAAPLVRRYRNEFVLRYLQTQHYADRYWDGGPSAQIWQLYTPLPEGSDPPVLEELNALRELRPRYHEMASAAPNGGAVNEAHYDGDLGHWVATTAGYMTWKVIGPRDTTTFGDLGGWALDLATFWAKDYVPARRADSSLRVVDFCRRRLCTDADSYFDYGDLVADVDGFLVYNRLGDGRDVADGMREILVNAQNDHTWRFRTFLEERFAGDLDNLRSAVRHLFSGWNPLIDWPARMITKNEREPGGRKDDRDPSGGELENELDDLADAFAARFAELTL